MLWSEDNTEPDDTICASLKQTAQNQWHLAGLTISELICKSIFIKKIDLDN
jgi:hypothetical protein